MKKKFFILFILIFVFSSSMVFAGSIPDMTDDMAEYIYEFYTNPEHLVVSSNSSFTTNIATNSINILNTITSGDIKNFFNTKFKNAVINSDLNIDYKNITLYGYYRRSSSSSDPTFRIQIIISNNTYPNNNDLAFQDYYYFISSSRLGSSQNNLYFTNMTIDYRGNVSNISSLSTGPYVELYPGIEPTFNEDETIMYLPFQLALSDYQECYYNDKAYIIGNRIQTEITPPSGDNESGDTGGGTTTPSGDTPGTTTPDYNEKLDNIQTGINNIENKIPTSGDITQAGVNVNKDYWGASGDLTGKEQEETIEQGINNIIDTVSGDFAKNEIFQMLDHFNNEMWGIFTGETDFKIEWSDVKYQETKLISAGSINFTQICKDIEILGYIKNLINIIISFHVILALVEQIYNLILSTLGIDNPYLYEDGNYTEITNVNTGERTEKLYRNRRVYKK